MASNKNNAEKEPTKAEKSKAKSSKDKKPGIVVRAKTYFKNVRTEMKRVVWPTKGEMVKYTGAVLGMLLFFGVFIAIIDAAVVPALYAFSGLR